MSTAIYPKRFLTDLRKLENYTGPTLLLMCPAVDRYGLQLQPGVYAQLYGGERIPGGFPFEVVMADPPLSWDDWKPCRDVA